MAMDPDTETFILNGTFSDLCRTTQVNRWARPSFVSLLMPFLPFCLASGKACVIQPYQRSAKS